ncbi:MAG: hypothetical protein LBV33_05125 [Lachnospiraceae bacterium]|nr:hypothetical protein [Lachnospiraceae bacterium]
MENYSVGSMPVDFGWALAANQRAMDGYSHMTEAEKEKIIMQMKDARSDRELQKIIDTIGLDEGLIGEVSGATGDTSGTGSEKVW